MMYPKEILNKIKYTNDGVLRGLKIVYISRGMPDDEASVYSVDILSLGKSFFIINKQGNETSIPYHRIKRIYHKDQLVWENNDSKDDINE